MPRILNLLKAVANTDLDKMMTAKIKAFSGEPVASNEDFELYIELTEINGFKFLNIKLLGPFNLSLIHISEPTRQAEISYAVFCLKKK